MANYPRFISGYDYKSMQRRSHFVTISGYNDDVGTAIEQIWSFGGTYTFPTAEMGMEIIGNSASDVAAGTGAQLLTIHYLDGSYVEKTTTVVPNGTNVVATTATDIFRINAFEVSQVGSLQHNSNYIRLRNLTDTPNYAEILATRTVSMGGMFTVPYGHEGFVLGWWGSAGVTSSPADDTYGEMELQIDTEFDDTLNTLCFCTKAVESVSDGSSFFHTFQRPLYVPQYGTVRLRGKADASMKMRGGFQVVYEDI